MGVGTAIASPHASGANVQESKTVQTDSQSQPVEIGEKIRNATESEKTVEAIVRFEDIDRERVSVGDRNEAIEQYKSHADITQRTFVSWAESHDAIEVKNRLWLANAVLVEFRTSDVSAAQLAEQPGVVRIHANHRYSAPDVEEGEIDAQNQNVTYGLEQLNVTDVWEMGITGEGAEVALLDTGVDPNHSDIDIDPAHWQEWDADGNPIDSDPNDAQYHGTHTSGTVVGDDDPAGDVPAYGVAPDATLWHGKVLSEGGGSYAQVVAGMEWTAENTSADIVGMSLGSNGYVADLIGPAENIRDAGLIFTASIGNSGAGTSGAPGNYYSSFASGAIDENYEPAPFSGGEVIDTQEAWGSDAPDWWPDQYTQPNAAAAGVNVLSAAPGNSYQELSGTSMSQPHKAGVFALMVSASGEVKAEQYADIVEETAWQPNGSDGTNTRYGHGVVDAEAAVTRVAYEQQIVGTVSDAEGEALEGAEVTVEETGITATTNESGAYELLHANGTWNVTVDAFGHAPTSESVELGQNETATHNVTLDPELDVKLLDGQQQVVEGGTNVSATATAAYADNVTVEETAGYSGNTTLYVDGEQASLGETVELDSWNGVEITVETEAGTNGTLALEHTFAGVGDEETVTTGPTQVVETLQMVAAVDENQQFGADLRDRLDDKLSPEYVVDVVSSSEALAAAENDSYDVYVVNAMDPSVVTAFDDQTAGDAAGVVWLDQWGPATNGIGVKSSVLGNPASTGEGDNQPYPQLEIADDHRIFEGVGSVGDTVLIHEGSWADHTWFSDYDGEVIGTIDAGSVTGGDAVGIDETKGTILLSSFGSSPFVSQSEYTDEADRILANSVRYLADSDIEYEAALSIEDTNVSGQFPDDEVTLTAEHNGTAGFQAFVEFDPENVAITDVEGEDISIQHELDNQDGWLYISGAQAEGIENPELADISINASGLEDGETTDLHLGGDSAVNDETGTKLTTKRRDGEIAALGRELGDVRGDGEIHSGDAVIVQRYLAGKEIPVSDAEVERYGDVDQDGEITSADVTAILQYITQPDHGGFDPDTARSPSLEPINLPEVTG